MADPLLDHSSREQGDTTDIVTPQLDSDLDFGQRKSSRTQEDAADTITPQVNGDCDSTIDAILDRPLDSPLDSGSQEQDPGKPENITPKPSAAFDDNHCAFLGLPPELRNVIYELAFEPELVMLPEGYHDLKCNPKWWTAEQVDLLESKPPQKELLLTCREIYKDSKKLYKAEYRKYWQQSRFFVLYQNQKESEKCMRLDTMKTEDIQHITHLNMIQGRQEGDGYCMVDHLLPNQSGWFRNWVSRSVACVYVLYILLEDDPLPDGSGLQATKGYFGRTASFGAEKQRQVEEEGLRFGLSRLGLMKQVKVILTRRFSMYSLPWPESSH